MRFLWIPIAVMILFYASGSAGDFPTKSSRMFFSAGTAAAFSSGIKNMDLEPSAYFELSFGYFVIPNLALGFTANSNAINSNYRFKYDHGLGPQISLFIGEGEYGDNYRGRLFPYLSLAVYPRWYNWRVRCFDCLMPPIDGENPSYEYERKSLGVEAAFGVARPLTKSIGYGIRFSIKLREVNDCPISDYALGAGFFSFLPR
jgi:hypothetical protein